uniref:Leucine-rich repeat-containing N-terminal plant-type domain-containing protein n=1 Tax=Fagus sylvatica TaxID=28930 RepID=A0A2N9EMC3_FAGSY
MTKSTPTFIQFSFYIIFFYFLLLVSHASPQLHHQEQAVLVNVMQYWQISSSNGWSSANCTPADCSPPADLITCINGSVTKVLLQNQGIALVPPFICDLKNLTVIDLSYNLIQGEFPTAFYNCSKLEYLDLQSNNLSGTQHR